jgi:hypothetical protein
MENKSTNKAIRNPLKAWIVKEVAGIYGVTTSEVYKVIGGERNNDNIVASYMTIHEGATKVAMLEAVTQLVPFENLN